MHHLSRALDSLSPGEPVILRKGGFHDGPCSDDLVLARLVGFGEIDGTGRPGIVRLALAAGGGIVDLARSGAGFRETVDGNRLPRGRLDPAWTDPLPDEPDEVILSYASALLANPRGARNPSILFHVVGERDGRLLAHLVSHVADVDDVPVSGTTGRSVSGNAVFSDAISIVERVASVATARVGDLIVASGFDGRHVDGIDRIRLEGAAILLRSGSRDEIGAFLPDLPDVAGSLHVRGRSGLAAPDDLDHAIARGRSRLEENEALVLVVREHGHGSAIALSHRGIVFLEIDDFVDHLDPPDGAEGLWVAGDATVGAWEGGFEIDVRWSQATEADVARFGFDRETLVREIVDVSDLDSAAAGAIVESLPAPSACPGSPAS